MKAGRLARILDAVDPDLEVGFAVDDGETREEHDAAFGRVEIGPKYVQVRVSLGDSPVYLRAYNIPSGDRGRADA